MAAIFSLGQFDGFMGNPKVRIQLPGYLTEASRVLKNFGQGRRIEALVLTLNRAAEAAVPRSKVLLIQVVRSLSVKDAKAPIDRQRQFHHGFLC